ncbi:MAG: hypothetical protein ACI9F9_003197 [Candidatus Paceibacteria bacterium]|jgi:hypothetical protein
MKRFLPGGVCLVLVLSSSLAARGPDETVLDEAMHHLGDDETPEWSEAPSLPEGSSLDFKFESVANRGEWTLAFYQRHISNQWQVKINGQLIAHCRQEDELLECHFPVPAGTLVEGSNHFQLTTDQPADDITFGRIRLIHSSFRETLGLVPLLLAVREESTGNPIPARLSLTDENGQPAQIYSGDTLHQAVRPGVLYTDNGNATCEVPAGKYQVVASRGSEWSIASLELELSRPDSSQMDGGLTAPNGIFQLQREVDTTGYIACDTHIHTLTFSGHGDSSVEERMVTLAGEGVELAISTDHNHNTDYGPYQTRMGLEEYFTTVVGNEVTTPIGHFNAFPLDAEQEIPPHDLHDLVQLVDGMRNKGAQVVILNHPRWPSHEKGPFGITQLNHFTGESLGAHNSHYPFDAMELANSTTEEKAPMLLFEDWFALLNRGAKVFAVGSSDSHTVGYPVGGGRTYVASHTDDPARIDVDAACAAIARGQTSVSMGIFVQATVVIENQDNAVRMGGMATPGQAKCRIELEVQAPSWVQVREAQLFANGSLIQTLDLSGAIDSVDVKPFTTSVELRDTHLAQDAWFVWVVMGDGIQGNHWPMLNDYTLGATNPIFLDWSGDGVYQSPRETALALFQSAGTQHAASLHSWEAVNFHTLDFIREALLAEAQSSLEQIGTQAGIDAKTMAEFVNSKQP